MATKTKTKKNIQDERKIALSQEIKLSGKEIRFLTLTLSTDTHRFALLEFAGIRKHGILSMIGTTDTHRMNAIYRDVFVPELELSSGQSLVLRLKWIHNTLKVNYTAAQIEHDETTITINGSTMTVYVKKIGVKEFTHSEPLIDIQIYPRLERVIPDLQNLSAPSSLCLNSNYLVEALKGFKTLNKNANRVIIRTDKPERNTAPLMFTNDAMKFDFFTIIMPMSLI